jgi:SAM-dependent methyltransferase
VSGGPISWILERSSVYRLWQLPFQRQKIAPLIDTGDIAKARRVLDVGCGPGTNSALFAHSDYLGVDVNAEYIADARRRYGREFVVADVTDPHVLDFGTFDFILVNSLLHHLDTVRVRSLLGHLSGLLSIEGAVHILDLVDPARRSIATALARADRGAFARPLNEWRSLFGEAFETTRFFPYSVGIGPVPLWNMVYFKGRDRV